MTTEAAQADNGRLDRPGRRRRAADRAVHRRPFRAGGVRPDLRRHRRTRRLAHRPRRGGRRDGRRSRGRGRSPLVRRPPLERPAAGGTQEGPASPRRARPREPRRAGAARIRSTSASRSATRSRVDIPSAATTLQWYAETIDKLYGEIGPTGPDNLSLITREPIGVVGAIVPWNYPMIISAWKLGAALATGNSVVLKPASQSPLTALRLAELASEAGLPDGVLNVVTGPGRRHRRRARAPPGRRQDRLHRLDRGRAVAPPRGRGDRRQGDLARARRQEPTARPRRCRRPRGRGIGHRLGDLLQQRPDLQRRVATRRPPIGARGAGRAHRRARAEARPRRAARPEDPAGLDRRRPPAGQGPRLRRPRSRGRRPRRRRRRARPRGLGRLLHPADHPRRRRQHACGSRARRSSARS